MLVDGTIQVIDEDRKLVLRLQKKGDYFGERALLGSGGMVRRAGEARDRRSVDLFQR